MPQDILTCLLILADAKALCSVTDGAVDIDLEAAWTETLREIGKTAKPALLHLLTLSPIAQASAETLLGWWDWYEERAGILEYLAGLSRAEAESQAWILLSTKVMTGAVVPGARDDA